MLKIEGIIEKGSDGMYSVRSEQSIGNTYFGGFGETVAVAKKDFIESVKDAFEDTGCNEERSITFKYDMPSFFNEFEYINASKFAHYAGINESKMRQYKSGTAFPGEKTTKKIAAAIRQIGKELSSVSI